MYKSKKNGIIGIIITIIILIFLVMLTNTQNSNLSYIENIADKLVNPIQNGLTFLKNKIHSNNSFFTSIVGNMTSSHNISRGLYICFSESPAFLYLITFPFFE